jgi:hypothetical protein
MVLTLFARKSTLFDRRMSYGNQYITFAPCFERFYADSNYF